MLMGKEERRTWSPSMETKRFREAVFLFEVPVASFLEIKETVTPYATRYISSYETDDQSFDNYKIWNVLVDRITCHNFLSNCSCLRRINYNV